MTLSFFDKMQLHFENIHQKEEALLAEQHAKNAALLKEMKQLHAQILIENLELKDAVKAAKERADRHTKAKDLAQGQLQTLRKYLAIVPLTNTFGYWWRTLKAHHTNILHRLEAGTPVSNEEIKKCFISMSEFFIKFPDTIFEMNATLCVTASPLLIFNLPCERKPKDYVASLKEGWLHGLSLKLVFTDYAQSVDVRFYPEILYPALMAVLQNCFQHGSGKDKPVTIDVENGYLTIHDQGPGIPEGLTLFQGPTSAHQKHDPQHYGLGLFLAREYCIANKSDIIYIPTEVGAKFGIKVLDQ